MFFLFAGYTYHAPKEYFVVNKVKRLLVPFVIYAVISLPFFCLMHYNESLRMQTGGGIPELLFNSFYIKGKIYNSPLWFLIVLFEIYMFSYYLKAFSSLTKALICAGCLISGYILYCCDLRLFDFLGLNRTVVMFAFFLLGNILGRFTLKKNNTRILFVFFLSLCLWIIFGEINGKISVYSFFFGNYFFFLLSSLGGAISAAILCFFFFNKRNFLSEIASYGILFLGTQYFWISPFCALTKRLNFSATLFYISSAILTAAYILLLPMLYRYLVSFFPKMKILNGE